MNILILAAGNIPANPDDATSPLCITEFGGKLLIELIYDAVTPLNPKRIISTFLDYDIRKYHLDDIVKQLSPVSKVIKVQNQTQGAACTALLAADLIDPSEELLIMNGNDLVNVDFRTVVSDFRKRELDAGTIIFESFHPRYSYVKLDGKSLVIEAAEKRPISRHATAGVYWYRKGSDFLSAMMEMISKGAEVNGRYYICPGFNEMLLQQKKIGVFSIPKEDYHPLKSEKQIEQYETSIERNSR